MSSKGIVFTLDVEPCDRIELSYDGDSIPVMVRDLVFSDVSQAYEYLIVTLKGLFDGGGTMYVAERVITLGADGVVTATGWYKARMAGGQS